MRRRELATAKGSDTRDRIYEAALALFHQHGFDETTMRDVAAKSEMATGAAYYYFRSKSDLVMEFYLRTADEMNEELPKINASTTDLKKRMQAILEFKFAQFKDHRRLLVALFKTSVDPTDPLSPFGDETKAIRDDAIAVFEKALEGSNLKVPKDLAPHLPRLLWMYQMALILYWIFDRSEEQKKTAVLLERSLDILQQLLKLSSLPLIGGLRRSVIKLIEAVS